MRVREYIQENRIDIGTSGTKTYNLDYTDPISQLDLYFEAATGSAGNRESPFERCISKIEIVDGGEVLWDLPGEVAFAAYCHDNEGVPFAEREETGPGTTRQQMPIRFGRWLWDPVYAFDPRKHKNPQLRFTFNEATINAAGSSGFTSDSWTFTLHVRLMEGAPVPKGFLSYRTVESFTTTAGGARRVEMPTDKVIRYLLCRAWEADVALYTSITHHKLSVDGGKSIPFDLPARDMMNRMCDAFKPIWLNATLYLAHQATHETWVGINQFGSYANPSSEYLVGVTFYIMGQVYSTCTSRDGTAHVEQGIYLCTHGWAIHNTLIYPFGDRNKPEDWFDPRALNKLDYFVTDGNADADCDICLQQVYGY